MKNISEKKIEYNGEKIKYFLRKSSRSKNIKIEIKKDGNIFLVVPKLIPNLMAIIFLKSKIGWVVKKQKEILLNNLENKEKKIPLLSKNDFLKYKKDAEILIRERVKFFAERGNFSYGKIIIKNNKTN